MSNPVREHWLANITVFPDPIYAFAKAKRLVCEDGFKVSVQAGMGYRSCPEHYLEDGNYSAWELGYPSAYEELLMPYVEDEERPTSTVYNFVPTGVVNQVIDKHGGLKEQVK